MKHNYCVSFAEVCLRPLEENEIEEMRLLRNKNRSRFVYSGEITAKEQSTWYQQYLNTPNDYMFSVYYRGCWIGAVAIYDAEGEKAEFGRLLLDREKIGRGGLGVQVTVGACKFAFEQLGLSTVVLEVYCDNPSAQITYLKAGFVPEQIMCDKNKKPMLVMTATPQSISLAHKR